MFLNAQLCTPATGRYYRTAHALTLACMDSVLESDGAGLGLTARADFAAAPLALARLRECMSARQVRPRATVSEKHLMY